MKNVPDVSAEIETLEKEFDDDTESIITNERYTYISSIISGCFAKKSEKKLSTSDKIDRIVTNRFLALPIFAFVMFIVYYVSVTTVGTWATDWANDGVFGDGWHLFGIGTSAYEEVADEYGDSDAIIGAYIDSLGDKGEEYADAIDTEADDYDSDAAVAALKKLENTVPANLTLDYDVEDEENLSVTTETTDAAGVKEAIEQCIDNDGAAPDPANYGVWVPGIMASRTIENDRDRKMTIMTTTFIPCGAKLPFIAMVAGAIFDGAPWVAPSAYFLGIFSIICSGIILKKTKLFVGDPAPFVMELPAYHLPTVGTVLRSMWERGWSFIKKAGTIITLSTIIIWFTTYFGFVDGTFTMLADDQIDFSILGRIGKAIAWIFAPLGFGNWQATVASITGLVAKENIVGTMGILYSAGEGTVYANMAATFTVVSGYAFLAFNLLCAPCFAAMGAIKREMNNTKWFWIAIGYQCGYAYLVGLVINQIAGLITGDTAFNVFTVIAILIIVGFIYLLFRPYKESKTLKVDSKKLLNATK